MNPLLINIVSAITIGIIIAVMAAINSNRLKALIYSFPIPITIALIATGGEVNITHLIGMVLGILFLWLVTFLYARGVHIIVADILSALAYLGAGFVAISYINVPFYAGVVCILIAWTVFIYLYRKRAATDKARATTKIHPLLKLPAVSLFAYTLLSLKSLFAGVIVTFPFSGVFAVIESRHMLERLSSTFTRNSIAILSLFVVIHSLGQMDVFLKIAFGWIAYIIILRLVTKFVPHVKT